MPTRKNTVKIYFAFGDGKTYFSEMNTECWLKKIGIIKIVDGDDEIYRLSIYPAELLVPDDTMAEATNNLLLTMPDDVFVRVMMDNIDRFVSILRQRKQYGKLAELLDF